MHFISFCVFFLPCNVFVVGVGFWLLCKITVSFLYLGRQQFVLKSLIHSVSARCLLQLKMDLIIHFVT